VIEFHDVYTTKGAVDVLYILMAERRNEDDPYVNISHREMPTRAEHEAFVERRPFFLWYLLSDGKEWLGYISITMRNEIGLILFRAHRGKGWGRKALQKLLETEKPLVAIPSERSRHFVANIHPLNDRSIYLFESLGFKLIQHTYSHES
jgi:RimJ/RimL family protein N-acetyltransferase